MAILPLVFLCFGLGTTDAASTEPRPSLASMFLRLVIPGERYSPVEVRALVDGGASVNETIFGGITPLMFAVIQHDLPTVRYLIENGADVNAQWEGPCGFVCGNTAKRYPTTALMLAAERSNPEIVRTLLEAGAEPNAPKMRLRTPLSEARRLHRDANVRLLLQYGAKR